MAQGITQAYGSSARLAVPMTVLVDFRIFWRVLMAVRTADSLAAVRSARLVFVPDVSVVVAGAALSVSGFRVGEKIGATIRMPFWAVRFLGVPRWCARPDHDVIDPSDEPKMLRVHACAVKANVVDAGSIGDWPHQKLVRFAVSEKAAVVGDRDLSVSSGLFGEGPRPAGVRAVLRLKHFQALRKLDRFGVHVAHCTQRKGLST